MEMDPNKLREFEDLVNKYQNKHIKYDQTDKHFEVGEDAWFITGITEVRPCTIIGIEGDSKNLDLVYYDIKPIGVDLNILDDIKFLFCSTFGFEYQPRYPWPGHSLSVGYDLFKTKDEAITSVILNSISYDLLILSDYYDGKIRLDNLAKSLEVSVCSK